MCLSQGQDMGFTPAFIITISLLNSQYLQVKLNWQHAVSSQKILCTSSYSYISLMSINFSTLARYNSLIQYVHLCRTKQIFFNLIFKPSHSA